MPFAKGKSGNPGGRIRKLTADGKSLRDLAREHTEECIRTLIELLKGGEGTSDAVRRAAAVDLLDRGWGKPAQAVELTGAEGGPIQTQALDASNLSEIALREIAAMGAVRETLQ